MEGLAVVRAVAADLGAAGTEEEVASAVLHAVGTQLGAATASLWLLTPDRRHLLLAYERDIHPLAVTRFARIPIDADLPGPHVVRTGEEVFLSSIAERDERWPQVAGTPTTSEALAVLPLKVTGTSFGVVAFSFGDRRRFADDDRLALLAVADLCAIALDRARLFQAALAASEANQLLARVSGAGGGHDWMRVAGEIASICTDGFVDACIVYLREGSVIRRIAGASRGSGALVSLLGDRFPTPLSSSAPSARAVRTGEAVRTTPPAAELLGDTSAEMSLSPEYHELAREVRFGDAWMLPLTDGVRPFGAMMFGSAEGDELPAATLALARQVADRTAVVLRSATEFAQHRAALDALHEVLLPPEVPVVEGFDIAACYVPFTAAPEVGGDWWDVLALPDGRVALSVGDVAGHGVPAVAVMGQLRNALRSRLVAGLDPAAALGELSALLEWTSPDAHATAVAVVAAPVTGELVWASAGHPPPLVVSPCGSARYLEEPPAPPLGITAGHRLAGYRDHHMTLPPGAALHLYSDGLIEGREQSIDDGLHALAAAAMRHGPSPLQVHCERLVAGLVERPGDDVCLLIARRHVGIEAGTEAGTEAGIEAGEVAEQRLGA